MLYDILPPLFFFGSFGGIIAVVSRVVLRIRRQQLSQEIQDQAEVESQGDSMLSPEAKGVKLFRSRLSLVPHILKRTASRAKNVVKVKREKPVLTETPAVAKEEQIEKPQAKPGFKIEQPSFGWRDKISESVQRSQTKVSSWGKNITKGIPTSIKVGKRPENDEQIMTEVISEDPGPSLRLINVESPAIAAAPKNENEKVISADKSKSEPEPTSDGDTTRVSLSRLFKGSTKKQSNSSLSRAALALEEGRFEEAEDILVPYLVDHTDDTGAYMLLGRAALRRRSWEEAVEIFQQVVKIDSRIDDAQYCLGHAALKSGHLTLALQSLQRAHDQAPGNKKVLNDLLKIAERQDNMVLKKSISSELARLKNNSQNTKVTQDKVGA